MVLKNKYSAKIGLLKSLKNLVIVVGIPALILFIDNWSQIFPNEWNYWLTPVMGFISYFVKNYIENK
jgi:hypothetical protein